MKTSSNTPPQHTITCLVQFHVVLVQQHYRYTKSRPICTCFLHTENPSHSGKATLKQFTLKSKVLSKNVTCQLELQPSHFLVFYTFIGISIVTTHKDSETICSCCWVN
jgi:hypothetical protein